MKFCKWRSSLLLLFSINCISLSAANKIDIKLKEQLQQSSLQKTSASSRTFAIVVQTKNDHTSFLHEYGLIGSQAGPYTTMMATAEQINKLVQHPEVAYLCGEHPLNLYNDIADRLIGGFAAAQAGYTGEEIIIGIVDTGIDVKHPAFLDAQGRTRILYYWDQELSGGHLDEFAPYGAVWTKADIDAGLCTSLDINGHGTHVAGCAAQYIHGTGSESRYNGSCTANLIVVKSSLNSIAVIEGISFIKEKAAQIGKPVVINLSLGSQDGPHDGTDLSTAMIDWLAGPQTVIVRSAGNDGDKQIHDMVAADSDGESMPFVIQPGLSQLEIECWYSGNRAVQFEMELPNGQKTAALQPGASQRMTFGNGAVIEISNAPDGAEYFNGDNLLTISATGEIPLGSWKLHFKCTLPATVHAWATEVLPHDTFHFVETDNHYTLANDACGHNVIVIGAAVSRDEFITQDEYGNPSSLRYPTSVGMIAPFSAGGPTRDGRQKPDLAMPGVYIVAAYSDDYAALSHLSDQQWLAETPFYPVYGVSRSRGGGGTSAASGIASGAIAQFLHWLKRLSGDRSINYVPNGMHYIGRYARPIVTFLDNPSKRNLTPAWDYREGWGYLDLRGLTETISLISCAQQDSNHIMVEFAASPSFVITPADFKMQGASRGQVTSLHLQNQKYLLTVTPPLKEGYRDTLAFAPVGHRDEAILAPITKRGTIVDLKVVPLPMVWRAENSPYFIHDEPQFLNSLKIEPGTVCKFISPDTTAGLLVNGRFEARGTAEQPIIFEPSNNFPNGWEGITIISEDSAIFSYCEIKKARDAIYAFGSQIKVHHCMIAHSLENGLVVIGGTPSIEHTIVWDSKGLGIENAGIWLEETTGNIKLQNLTLVGNKKYGVVAATPGPRRCGCAR